VIQEIVASTKEEIIQKAVLDETILKDLSLYRVKIDNGKEITERPCTLKDLEEEYNKLNKRNINVSYYDFKILKKLLRRLGVPYIVAMEKQKYYVQNYQDVD